MTVRRAPLCEVATALRRGEVDATTYVERCLERVDSVDPDVRAFVPEPDRSGRVGGEAARVVAQYPGQDDRPPLFGVPVGVKDVFHVDGLPTRAGSDLPPEVLAGPEAAAVSRLRAAGAVVLGKTVTTEFAYFAPGPTRNPHDVAHTPGGSSSGSAAAVAAGLCPLAVGTQTAGSVIRPAAFCGVVGFKPTVGRVPIDGVIPLAPSLDTVGLFAQDVAGARLAVSVLVEGWTRDGRAAGTIDDERPTLGVPDGAYLDRADRAGRARFERHLDRLGDAGFDVVRTRALDDVDRVLDQHETLMTGEAAAVHDDWYEAHGDRYAPETASLVEDGRATSTAAITEAREGQFELRESLGSLMADRNVDVWVAPSAPGPAPRGLESTGDPVMNAPWTYAGLPAVTVPAGAVEGLPIGLQCVGAPRADERLLDWAEAIAAALDGPGG